MLHCGAAGGSASILARVPADGRPPVIYKVPGPGVPLVSLSTVILMRPRVPGDWHPPCCATNQPKGSLPGSAGVKWFEVDKLDVLNAKRRSLEAAGASCKPGQGAFLRPAHWKQHHRAKCQAGAATLPDKQLSLPPPPLANAAGICIFVDDGHTCQVPRL